MAFNITILHDIDLVKTLDEVLTDDQKYELMERGGRDYQYPMTVTVEDLENIKIHKISGHELKEALIFIQKSIGDFNAKVVVLGSAAIEKESIKYSESLDASNKAYWAADAACRNSA
jgi:hypothetical protein